MMLKLFKKFERHFSFELARVTEFMCKFSHFIYKMNSLVKIKPLTALLKQHALI